MRRGARYLAWRLFGVLGLVTTRAGLGPDMETPSTPPADAGLLSAGPMVAIWLGMLLVLAYPRVRLKVGA
jgi:hypothetical protein